MRTNRKNPKLLYTPTLPKRHQFFSSRATRLTAQLLAEVQGVLRHLERTGVIGAEEHEEVKRDLVKLSKRINDIHKRERISFSQRLDRDLGQELEENVLKEIKANPDKARFLQTPRLRQRLRSCTWELLDFVETSVESLKRLRYSNYITEKQYDNTRSMVESLPELRVELLELLEKYGDA